EPSRARRLKQLTHEVHETLDRSIMAAASFDTLPGYVRFVEVQYRFHRDIAAIYADPALSTLLPGLAARCRLELIETDLADLGRGLPATE
ncbi:biliverdin-producing heme oxygenase, partial [Escherichia coli]